MNKDEATKLAELRNMFGPLNNYFHLLKLKYDATNPEEHFNYERFTQAEELKCIKLMEKIKKTLDEFG